MGFDSDFDDILVQVVELGRIGVKFPPSIRMRQVFQNAARRSLAQLLLGVIIDR
jgi:hypothetical protein